MNASILKHQRSDVMADNQKNFAGRPVGLSWGWVVVALLLLQACAPASRPTVKPTVQPRPYRVDGTWYHPLGNAAGFQQAGIASWYGEPFHGRRTSSGEIYNMHEMTAAHKILPMGTYVRVRHKGTGKEIQVRINDRGPFVRGRIIDLSYAAAKQLGIVGTGTAPVEIEALGARVAGGGAGAPVTYKPLDYYSGQFTFQVGAFTEKGNAERLKAHLERLYTNAHIVAWNSGNGIFYRVRVGRCTSLDEAVQYEQKLISGGYPEAFIVAE